jgi:iron(III) transport system ATP-binding protein
VSTALAVAGLVRSLGGRRVVDDVTLEVSSGELVALVGPSGCGKSTLLRLIAGLDRPDGGRVVLDGVDVTGVAPERRRIGLVFQEHALFPHLTVRQNVAFGLRGMDRRQRAARVDELLELVRLPGSNDRYPHELSGGEQQRVALARALAPEPAVVLLDEPFASLDASLRDEMRDDVMTALRLRRAAAVLVTHDRDEALALGHRVAVMVKGRIAQIDRPEVVWERPVDEFVARFMGPGSLLTMPDGNVALARPHQLTLEPGGDATVVARRYLGAVWRLDVRNGDGSTMVVDHAGAGFAVGEACNVAVPPVEVLHRFPSRNEPAEQAER